MIRIEHPVLVIAVTLFTVSMARGQEVLVNDLHSRLNATWVERVVTPTDSSEVLAVVKEAARADQHLSIAGGRHAMGGQQFAAHTVLLSTEQFNDVLALDTDRGIVTVESGIRWPKLIDTLLAAQPDDPQPWSIVQKQTGADELSIGGALSANVHGRGLTLAPIVQDVEAFRLVDADGEELLVDRENNAELFGLVIGGYGLFGVITTVELRLQRRVKLERVVTVTTLGDMMTELPERIDQGHHYGDFQFKTDASAEDFLLRGVFSSYRPVSLDRTIPEGQQRLDANEWSELLALAYYDKGRAFELYSNFYRETNGQLYWSDSHQLSFYEPDYQTYLADVLPEYRLDSLMISELYVPRARLADFMQAVAEDARRHQVDIIYGTIRMIRKDVETFLPWAKEDYACVIFNLRVKHDEAGIAKAQSDFQRLIDRALERDGSYFLTYHRWARKDQVLRAYPQFIEFLRMKRNYDPAERFQSEWYRYYRQLFESELRISTAPQIRHGS